MTTAAEILTNPDVKQSFESILAAYDAHRAEEIRAERDALAAMVQGEQQRRPRARL